VRDDFVVYEASSGTPLSAPNRYVPMNLAGPPFGRTRTRRC